MQAWYYNFLISYECDNRWEGSRFFVTKLCELSIHVYTKCLTHLCPQYITRHTRFMTYGARICQEFLVCVSATVYACVSQRCLKITNLQLLGRHHTAENISQHVTELLSWNSEVSLWILSFSSCKGCWLYIFSAYVRINLTKQLEFGTLKNTTLVILPTLLHF